MDHNPDRVFNYVFMALMGLCAGLGINSVLFLLNKGLKVVFGVVLLDGGEFSLLAKGICIVSTLFFLNWIIQIDRRKPYSDNEEVEYF